MCGNNNQHAVEEMQQSMAMQMAYGPGSYMMEMIVRQAEQRLNKDYDPEIHICKAGWFVDFSQPDPVLSFNPPMKKTEFTGLLNMSLDELSNMLKGQPLVHNKVFFQLEKVISEM